MGFMAGFGSAFADSFNKENDRLAQQKEDTFKLQYQDYMSKTEYRMKQDLENKKNLKLAKSIVSMSGQPPEAVTAVYDMISNGLSAEQAMKYLEANQAVVSSNTTTKPGEGATASDAQSADPRDNLSTAAQSSVDSQMAASGMKAPESGGIFGNLKQGMHDIFSSGGQQQRAADQGTQRIAAATGSTPEEVKSTLAGNMSPSEPVDGLPGVSVKWQPKPNGGIPLKQVNNLGDALAYKLDMDRRGTPQEQVDAKNQLDQFMHLEAQKAAMTAEANGTGFSFSRGFIKDENGGWTGGVAIPQSDGKGGNIWRDAQGNQIPPENVLPADKNMEQDIRNISTEMAKPLQDYNQAKTDMKTLARTSAEISKLAKEHPEAMGKSGDLSQWSDQLLRAGINVAKLVNPKLDPNGNVAPDQGALGELEKSEQAINGMIKSAVDRNAQNALYATLMDIKATRLAYLWAKDMGQQSRGVSNADFNNFKEVAKGGGNPQALKQSAADFLAEKLQGLRDQESLLQQGGADGVYFEQKYHGVPNPFKITSTIDQEIGADPMLQQSLDTVNDNAKPAQGSQVQPKGAKGHPDWKPIGKSPDGRTVYEDPNGDRWVE